MESRNSTNRVDMGQKLYVTTWNGWFNEFNVRISPILWATVPLSLENRARSRRKSWERSENGGLQPKEETLDPVDGLDVGWFCCWLVVWNLFYVSIYWELINNNHPNWLICFRGVETTNQCWVCRLNVRPPQGHHKATTSHLHWRFVSVSILYLVIEWNWWKAQLACWWSRSWGA